MSTNKPEVVTRLDLTEQLWASTNLTKAQAKQALYTTLDLIESNVAAGKKVQLIHFGSFTPVQRATREGRNPQTGQSVTIPAHTSVKFKAGNKFKESLTS